VPASPSMNNGYLAIRVSNGLPRNSSYLFL
jgi:hypothetical protein